MAQSAVVEHNKLVAAISENIGLTFTRKRNKVVHEAGNNEEQKRLLKRGEKILADIRALREDAEKLGYTLSVGSYGNNNTVQVSVNTAANKLWQHHYQEEQEAQALLTDYSRELLLRQLSGEVNALSGFTIPEKLKKLL